jgi:hypothetical protein
MTSKMILRTAVRSAFILSVLMTAYACNFNKPGPAQTSNDLTFVRCDPNGKHLPVTHPGTVPPATEFIFVCAGNEVEWFTDEGSFKFTVDFDPLATDLFVSRKTHFESELDPSGKHKHAIKGEKVSEHANKLQDHPYRIHPTGTPVPASDPHVIPM